MTVRPLVYHHVSGRNTQGTILDHQGTFQVLNREIVLCLLEFQNGLHRQTEPWMRHVQESQDKGKIMRMSWLQVSMLCISLHAGRMWHTGLIKYQCDEKRPTCGNCKKSGRECPGYPDEFDLVFRDENKAMARKARKTGPAPVRGSPSGSSSQPSPNQ